MAESNQTLDALKSEFLECHICTEQFDISEHEPRLLPCLHTFCTSCLQKKIKNESLDCFICRANHTVKGDDVEVFLKDNNRRELLDFVNVRSKSASDLLCGECKQNPACSRCRECAMFMCEACTTAHRRSRFTKGHDVNELSKLKDSTLESFNHILCCEQEGHSNQPLSLYCTLCEKVVCIQCGLTDHTDTEGHKKEDCSAVSEDKKDTLRTKLQKIETAITRGDSLKESIENEKLSLNEVEKKINMEVDAFVNNCIDMLKKEGRKLKKGTNTLCGDKDKVLEMQLSETKEHLKRMEDALRFTKQTLEHKNHAGFLQLEPTISQRLDDILQEEIYGIPNENAAVNFHHIEIAKLQEVVLGMGRIEATSVFPPKTEVIINPYDIPGTNRQVLQIHFHDYQGNSESPENARLDINLHRTNGEKVEFQKQVSEDGVVSVTADLKEGEYVASVGALGHPISSGGFIVAAPKGEAVHPEGTKAYLDALKSTVIKARYMTCSSCKRDIDDSTHHPILLPCLHIIGNSCAEQMSTKQPLKCPKCDFGFVAETIDDLPVDPLYPVMKTYLAIRDSDETPLICSSRQCHNRSTTRCIECSYFICDTCAGTHTKHPGFQNHRLKTIDDLRGDSQMADSSLTKMCSVEGHQSEQLKMFCETCQKVTCTMCIISSPCIFEKHKIAKHISAIYKAKKDEFSSLLEQGERRETELENIAGMVESEQGVVAADQEKVTGQVEDEFRMLSDTINGRKDALIKEVGVYSNGLQAKLRSQLLTVQLQKQNIKDAQSRVTEQMSFNDTVSFLAIQNKVATYMKNLFDAPFATHPCQRSALQFEDVNVEHTKSSLSRVGNVWKPDICPWLSKVLVHDAVYVGQSNNLLTLQLMSSDGKPLANGYKDGVVEIKVACPKGGPVQTQMKVRKDDASKIDVHISPSTPDKHLVCIAVMQTPLPKYECNVEVKGKSKSMPLV